MEEELERIRIAQEFFNPEIIAYAERIVTTNATMGVAVVLLSIVFGYASFSMTTFSFRRANWKDLIVVDRYQIFFAVSLSILIICFLVFTQKLADIWTWMAFFDVRLAAIHYLLEKIGGS